MLLLASRILEHELNREGRLRLLEKLQEREFTPLIRSARLNCFEQALADALQVEEMERLIAASTDSDAQVPYVQGDIFCFSDHVFFLLFGDQETGPTRMRAGIVYETRTAEPLRKLNSFCQAISLCIGEEDAPAPEGDREGTTQLIPWRQDSPAVQDGFIRFVVRQDPDTLSAVACRENSRERVRAAKLLEDRETRSFLRRAKEAYAEGYPVGASADADATGLPESVAGKLSEAGLLRREVLVSCRKSGHTLFSLPSADALAVVTISQARCSECGTSIADEKVEEVFVPTNFSHVLMEDGAWLVNRLHSILRELGISESEIAVEPPAGDGEARLMARVCDESFLIVMRDGDLTPAFARRAINTKLETDARHLLIVATGKIHNEGRESLSSFAKRLERGGNDFELIIADGASSAAVELRRAFERVSHKALAEQLCELDSSLGLSVPHLIEARFQLLDSTAVAEPPARLPASTDRGQELQNAAQIVPAIDLNILENVER